MTLSTERAEQYVCVQPCDFGLAVISVSTFEFGACFSPVCGTALQCGYRIRNGDDAMPTSLWFGSFLTWPEYEATCLKVLDSI